MAYTYPVVPVGAIYQITFRMRHVNQRLINTYHWSVTQNTANKVVDYIADLFHTKFSIAETGLYDTHKVLRDSLCKLEDVQIQMIYPQRYVSIGKLLNQSGTNVTVGLEIPNISCSITRRSVEATRRGVSNLLIPIAPSDDLIGEGVLEAAATAALQAHGNAFLGLVDLGEGVLVKPVIYHRGAVPVSSVIESFLVQPTIRVVRRRTVGRGE